MKAGEILLLIALSLAACSGNTDQKQAMDVAAHLSDDAGGKRAEFVCKQSTTGGCNFTVFVEKCSDPKDQARPKSGNCARQVLNEFTLNAGDARVVERLPLEVRYCVKPRDTSETPVCPSFPSSPPSVMPSTAKPQVT